MMFKLKRGSKMVHAQQRARQKRRRSAQKHGKIIIHF